MLQLRFMDGPAERRFDLAPGVYYVGRSGECDLVLHDKSVSSRHLRLDVRDDGVVEFRDLMSSNGTRLHGHRTDAGQLAPNDRLRVGRVKVRVVDANAADADGMDNGPDGDESDSVPGAPGMADAPSAGPFPGPRRADEEGEGTPVAPLPPVPAQGAAAAPRALMVMPEPGAALSATVATGAADPSAEAAAKRAKAIRLGAVAAGVVLLAAIVLVPSKETAKKPPEPPPWQYDPAVQEGVRLFREGKYGEAAKKLEVAAAEAKRRNIGRMSAQVFGDIARDLDKLSRTGRTDQFPWEVHNPNLEEIYKGEDQFSDFALTLTRQLRRVHEVSENLTKAERAVNAGRFDEARQLINDEAIARNRVLKARADAVRGELERRVFAELERRRAAAKAANNLEEWRAALGELTALRPDDKVYADELERVEREIGYAATEAELVERGQYRWPEDLDGHDTAIRRLQDALTRVYPRLPKSHVDLNPRLQRIHDDYQNRLFRHGIAKMFYAWDTGNLEKALKDERADHPDLAAIRRTYAAAVKARDDFEEAKRKGDVEQAQHAIIALLALDVFPEGHPMRQWATRNQLTRAQIVIEMLLAGRKHLEAREYSAARRIWGRVQRQMRYDDPTELARKLDEFEAAKRTVVNRREQFRRQRNEEKVNELDGQIQQMDEENAALIAEGREKGSWLALRADLIKQAQTFLNQGLRNKSANDFISARECLTPVGNDTYSSTYRARIENEYRRMFGQAMPPMPKEADVLGGEEEREGEAREGDAGEEEAAPDIEADVA